MPMPANNDRARPDGGSGAKDQQCKGCLFLLFDIFVRLAWRDSSIEGGKEI